MPKGRPHNPHCISCGILKTEENAYRNSNGGASSYCKSCEKESSKQNKRNKRLGIIPMKKNPNIRSVATHQWTKTNKNHYPDPDWVWTQIENNESPAMFMEKLDQKYSLSAHGNKGKNNRWKNK